MNLKTRCTIAGVALTLGFFLFSAFDLYSGIICSDLPCYGSSCGCTRWSDWAERSEVVTLPDYPTCPLRFWYCYRQCLSDPTCVEININSYQFVNPEGCDDLKAFLNSGSPYDKAIKQRSIYNEAFRQVSRLTFDLYCNDRLRDGQELPWCDQQDIRYKVTAYPAECMAACTTQYPISDPSIEYLVTYVRCTEEACCTHVLKFCKNRNLSTVMEEEVTPGGTCALVLDAGRVCPPGQNVDITPCISYCSY